jgi:uncharacterized protein (DUF927 family)
VRPLDETQKDFLRWKIIINRKECEGLSVLEWVEEALILYEEQEVAEQKAVEEEKRKICPEE